MNLLDPTHRKQHIARKQPRKLALAHFAVGVAMLYYTQENIDNWG